MKEQINYLTTVVFRSLRYNKHLYELHMSKDIKDMKRLIADIYFPNSKPDERFVKGAKIVQWELIYELAKKYELR